jgi:glutamine amidotransferase
VAILDYGVGNLFSLECALKKVDLVPFIISSPLQWRHVDALVLPGVGNFAAASQNLKPLKHGILDAVEKEIPLLGICLGMQLLFAESEESEGRGLSLFKGKNVKLPKSVKVPHMGWNTLHVVKESDLLEGLQEEAFAYFVHSYYPNPLDEDIIMAKTTYGVPFASAIAKKNLFGTQFHPEKSGKTGTVILKNFAKIVKG